MIIDEIANKLMSMHHDYCTKHVDYLKNRPKFAIYVGMDTYMDMKTEISGGQAQFDDNILGFPVYRTIDHNGWKIYREE